MDIAKRSNFENDLYQYEEIKESDRKQRMNLVHRVFEQIDQLDPWMALISFEYDLWKQRTSINATEAFIRVCDVAIRSINKIQHVKHPNYLKIWLAYCELLRFDIRGNQNKIYLK